MPEGAPLHAIIAAVGELAADMSLLAISRTAPPPARAGVRAERRLTLVDWADLRLRPDESAAMADVLRIPESVDRAALHRRVDGWPAGLALMADTLRRNPTLATDADGERHPRVSAAVRTACGIAQDAMRGCDS